MKLRIVYRADRDADLKTFIRSRVRGVIADGVNELWKEYCEETSRDQCEDPPEVLDGQVDDMLRSMRLVEKAPASNLQKLCEGSADADVVEVFAYHLGDLVTWNAAAMKWSTFITWQLTRHHWSDEYTLVRCAPSTEIKDKLIKTIAQYYVILNKDGAAPSKLRRDVEELSQPSTLGKGPVDKYLSLFRDSGLFDARETVAMGIRKFKRDLKRPRPWVLFPGPELDPLPEPEPKLEEVDSLKSKLDSLVDSLDGSTPAAGTDAKLNVPVRCTGGRAPRMRLS